jgi:competence protein ComEA
MELRLGIRGPISRILDAARAAPGEAGLVALLAVVVLGAAGFVYARTAQPPPPPIKQLSAAQTSNSQAEELLIVHVAGAVASPGVFELPKGSRVKDAIDAAGGAIDGADLDSINLAAPIADGEKIFVPKPGEGVPPDQGSTGATGGKVNLNSATQSQLEELPGVGPVLAQRMLEYRQKKGRFSSVRQLMEVEGIGDKKYDSLKDLVTV